MLRLVGCGLKLCKQRLKYSCKNSFSTSKFETVENKVWYIKLPPEVVFGCFYMFTKTIAKWYLPGIICVKQGTYMLSVEYFNYKKGSQDTKTTVVWGYDRLGS